MDSVLNRTDNTLMAKIVTKMRQVNFNPLTRRIW